MECQYILQNLVLCFRLHFAKDSTTINTAGATVRQLISLVFERVVAEDKESSSKQVDNAPTNIEELKVLSSSAPKGLRPCAADAYLMFQVILRYFSILTREWSQLSDSDLIETHTTYNEPQKIINRVEIFCKWPLAARPEATKDSAPCYSVPPLQSLPPERSLTILYAFQSCFTNERIFFPP